MNSKAVLLDTSFFLRFLNDKDPLYKNADGRSEERRVGKECA